MKVIHLSKKQTYGNLHNRIMENYCLFDKNFVIPVGFGATEYLWSDRKPYSVCEVFQNWNNKGFEIIVVQQDNAKRLDNRGMSDDQDYEFTPNLDAPKKFLRSVLVETETGIKKMYESVHFNPETGRWNKGGSNIVLGKRSKYHDFSF